MSNADSGEVSRLTTESAGLPNAHDVAQRSTVTLSESIEAGQLAEILDQRTFNKDVISSLRLLRQLVFYKKEPVPFKPVPGSSKGTDRRDPPFIGKLIAYIGFLASLAWAMYIFVTSSKDYLFGETQNFGQVLLGLLYGSLTFGAVLWNVFSLLGYLFRLLIPTSALRKNGVFFSITPEEKDPLDEWPTVTIQVPVYKESFQTVIRPTIESCMEARDDYIETTGSMANIVICEDGLLRFLKNNVDIFDQLWANVVSEEADVISKDMYEEINPNDLAEVVERLRFYHENNIGFVGRTTHNRRGKFKKAGNLNHSIWTRSEVTNILTMEPYKTYDEALRDVTRRYPRHPYVAEGDVQLGDFIVLNDSDARMAKEVIKKTVPEFLNEPQLAFTQHSTKTLDDQRGKSYFLSMMAVYIDALYQLHFVAGAALGYHPPLVGHSVFLRTEALEACGRMQEDGHIVFWSEGHISEDFELMMNFYNAGYIGRYVAYEDCEFQEGVTRTFDEEARKMRKFSTGAHELMFNPMSQWFASGIFSDVFHRFVSSALPTHYKLHLIAYLASYFSTGIFFIVIFATMVLFILGLGDNFFAINPIAIVILNLAIYTIVGMPAFLILITRIKMVSPGLLFKPYRTEGYGKFFFKQLFLYTIFQLVFFNAVPNHLILGATDHIFSRKTVFGATNKDENSESFFRVLRSIVLNNLESWVIASLTAGIVIVAWILSDASLITTVIPPIGLSVLAFVVPFLLNPDLWNAMVGRNKRPDPVEQV